jgi:thiamine pyrophosphate-dependent acetolactate synthase large subunit-like protein
MSAPDIDHHAVVLPTGAGFHQVRGAEGLAADLSTAIRQAHAERRPIVLNVPSEFQWREVDYSPGRVRPFEPQAVLPSPEALDQAVGVIASARRPIVLAGQGAATSEARCALVRLAKRIGAPLATTLRARDLMRGNPYNLGIFGSLSHDLAVEVIGQSDFIVAFGASLNHHTTAQGSHLRGKRVVHIDADPAALQDFGAGDASVVGDAAKVADEIVGWLDEPDFEPTGFASAAMAERLATRSEHGFQDRRTSGSVDLRAALLRLEEAFPRDRTLVVDAGRFTLHTWRFLHVAEPSAYVHTVSFGSIGLGMGNATGAGLAVPDRPVFLMTGDGGFMLGGLAEFSAAVRHKVDLVIALFNDGAYGAEHVQFRDKDMNPEISMFDWPEFAPVATALGGHGITVRSLDELDQALEAIAERDRPVLLDIKVNPDDVARVPR